MSVDVDRRGPVTVVTLNRPQAANALDRATMGGIGAALTEAEQDPEVRAVIITGAGEKIFCAGMDLKAFASGESAMPDGPGLEVLTQRVYPKPTIAAINGTAVAGGFELMMGCDLVVAAEHARFGIPEVKRGLIPAGGATRLPRRIPLAVALELALTGEMISSARALELGLINRVVPGPQVLDEAFKLAELIAANGPLALKVTKELIYDELGTFDWDAMAATVKPVFESNDAREGAIAFAERRAPKWTGT